MLTVWNALLPMCVLGALGWVVPRMLTHIEVRSHKAVLWAVIGGAVLMWLISALVAMLLDREAYQFVFAGGGLFLTAEVALRQSALFALAWGPMVLLSWLGLAQRVEDNRGQDLLREEA